MFKLPLISALEKSIKLLILNVFSHSIYNCSFALRFLNILYRYILKCTLNVDFEISFKFIILNLFQISIWKLLQTSNFLKNTSNSDCEIYFTFSCCKLPLSFNF